MREEIELVVEAIESLQRQSNLFKDYMFPLVTGFFSSILGALVAYFTISHQDNNKLQKERIYTINDWFLLAEGAATSLIAIKSNYHGKLENNPFQRTLITRSLIHSTKMLDKNLSSLSFIVPKKEKAESQAVKWRQLPRIGAMVKNYNFVIELWDKRSEIDRPIKEKLMRDHGTLAYMEVSQEQIFQSVNPSEFIVLIDLTERAIKYTDDLIVEIENFMTEFPNIGKSLISEKYINRYGPILTKGAEDNPKRMALINKSPEVDYAILAELFGSPEEQVRSEYSTGYG